MNIFLKKLFCFFKKWVLEEHAYFICELFCIFRGILTAKMTKIVIFWSFLRKKVYFLF